MTPNPAIVKSIEKLQYRVTVGDVAAQAGLNLNLTQQGLLALASDAGGHLQVSDTGEIVFLFPKNFRTILRNKFWRIRLKESWEKVWRVLFYLIRISFGIILIVSIVLMAIAITIVLSSRDGNDNSGSSSSRSSNRGGGLSFFWTPDLFWIFDPGYNYNRQQRRQQTSSEMNFLEAIFSFLFGDGNPNANLETIRAETIGAVILNNRGAIIAEQLAPYLDAADSEDEDYILPVLTKFNGYPEVTDRGEIIYYFPELQVTAARRQQQSVPAYLEEQLWHFSRAGSGQTILAIGLGAANLILALVLGSLLRGNVAELGEFIIFVASIYWLLLGYGTAFLVIPLLRYFWIRGKNAKIKTRDRQREERALKLERDTGKLQPKLAYARQFAAEKTIGEAEIAYSTETDLLDQELKNVDKLDREWQKRLESDS